VEGLWWLFSRLNRLSLFNFSCCTVQVTSSLLTVQLIKSPISVIRETNTDNSAHKSLQVSSFILLLFRVE
jgi:hypothetical protein